MTCRRPTTGSRATRRTSPTDKCLGVTGQFVDEPASAPYVNPEQARRNVLSFNLLKWQRVYARTDVKKRVE